jgi:ubiquinone/menaquinone biosynthesis C-methylase UbiE
MFICVEWGAAEFRPAARTKEDDEDMESLLSGLRAAGEKTRLRLLLVLAHGELNVKELTQILGQSQPRISRHLKLLCEAGLLQRYREGSWVLFRLADASNRSGALVRMIIDLVPGDEPVLTRDLQRLEAVREQRRRAAADYFSANAADWDKIRTLHVEEAAVEQAMRAVMGGNAIGSLLDLGTGTGRVLQLFADQVGQGIGIDSSQQMLAYARANLEQAGLVHCQVRHGDLYHLPYDSGSKDAVTIHQVLHYLDNPQLALQEAARVLAPDGRMLIVDFAPHELEFLRDEHAHRRLGISNAQMDSWILDAGMSVARDMSLPPARGKGGGLTVRIWLATPGVGTRGGVRGRRTDNRTEAVQ